MEVKKKILQVTGAIHQLATNKDLGSTKDMATRANAMSSFGMDVVSIGIAARQDSLCAEELKKIDLKSFSHVMFEHNRYPSTQLWLKKAFPHITVLVRAHNAEAIHCIEKAIAIANQPFHDGRRKKFKKIFKTCLRAIKTIYLDVMTANNCDYLLSCSDHETKNYWNILNKKSTIITIGTLSICDHIEHKNVRKPRKNVKIRVCMVGGSVQNEFNDISLAQYSRHLKQFPEQIFEKFSFSHSGQYGPVGRFVLPYSSLIDPATTFEDLMNSYDVLIVCTDLGRGIKTKILDAMAFGKPVILPNGLQSRLDISLKNGSISYDGTTKSLQLALDNIQQKHDELRSLSQKCYHNYEQKYRIAFEKLMVDV